MIGPSKVQNLPITQKGFCELSIAKLESVWKYIGKTLIISRNLLNAAARDAFFLAIAHGNFPNHVKVIANYTKLFSIVSVVISLKDLDLVIKKLIKSIQFADLEGVALNLTSFTIIALDAIDSTFTSLSAAMSIAALEPLRIISALSMPLPVIMSSLGIVSRTVQIAKSINLSGKIDSEILNKPPSAFKASVKSFLKETLTDDSNQISERKKAALLRHISQAAFAELESAHKEINSEGIFPLSQRKIEKISASLINVQSKLNEKIVLDAVGITANLTLLCAMALFSIGTAGALPFLLVASGFTLRLGTTIYQEYH